MKKTTFILVFSATILGVLFQSCTSNQSANNTLQKPDREDSTLTSKTEMAGIVPVVSSDAIEVSVQNLQAAFKGETTASAKYAAYSKKAEEDGYHEIALLFKAASVSESVHARNHQAVLEEAAQKVPEIKPEFTVKSTRENLEDAIAGESYEVSTMYPEFIKNAGVAGNQLALISLNYAYKTEQKHKVFYEKALAGLDANNANSLPAVYYVCPTCGNTYESTSPKRCGISMTGSERFVKITSVGS